MWVQSLRCAALLMWYHTSQELLHIFSTSQCCKVSWHRCTFFASLSSYRLGPSSQICIMYIKSKGSTLSHYASESSKLHLNLKSFCTMSKMSFSYRKTSNKNVGPLTVSQQVMQKWWSGRQLSVIYGTVWALWNE